MTTYSGSRLTSSSETEEILLGAVADAAVRGDLDARRNDNYGKNQALIVGTGRGGNGIPFGGADAMRSLVQFDLSQVPEGQVEMATLELTLLAYDNGSSASQYTIDVHRLSAPWQEGNGYEGPFSSTTGAPPGAVNTNLADGVAWLGAGDNSAADAQNNQTQPPFDAEVVATTVINQGSDPIGKIVRWDVTSLVNDWLAGSVQNHGLLLRDVTTDNRFRGVFFSARETDVWNFPGATLPYLPPGPQLRISLQPSINQEQRGDEFANVLFGDVGEDILLGFDGNDSLYGRQGNDLLDGGAGRDRLFGQGGDDQLLGGPGADFLQGGNGKDQLEGDTGNDYLEGGSGDDVLDGGDGDDRLLGQAGNDDFLGGQGDDVLFGGSGNDRLKGNAGNDRLYGDSGNDILRGEDGDDWLFGGSGDDYLVAGAGQDHLYGGPGRETLLGKEGDDKLWGENGDDILAGEDGNDSLWGGNGDDILSGGRGKDILFGGAGADRFVLFSGNDQIIDYRDGVDKFETRLTFGSLPGQIEAVATPHGVQTQLKIVGSGEILATINGIHPNMIDSSDFVV